MTLVNAIQVLFAQTAPAGADFAGAFDALKGKRDSDLSQADANTLGDLAETFQDFVGDPSGWIEKAKKVTVADPRHSWWAQLAQALGASVLNGSASVGAPSPSTSGLATPSALDIEPQQGIDPDALAGGAPEPVRREGGGGRSGGGASVRTGTGKAAVVIDPVKEVQKEPDTPGKIAPAVDNPDDGKVKPSGDPVAPVPPSPVPPPDPVHDFQSREDRGRLRRELIREERAATRHETEAALRRRQDAEEQVRQRRLDADALERQRRFDEDAKERTRRQTELEAANQRRIADETAESQAKRLVELQLAAEQRRLDAEEAERNRLADEDAAQRKRLADENADQRKRLADEDAEERKLMRKEAADARKRLADEDAAQRKRLADEDERLARKAREDQEAAAMAELPKPKPLIDVTDRTIPAITREILTYSSYKSWSSMLIEAFRLIRTGTPTEQAQKRAEIPYARRLIESMKCSDVRMEVQAGFHLERLLGVLEAGRDQREPDWFQANYVTGSY